jgi:hypothetical protein
LLPYRSLLGLQYGTPVKYMESSQSVPTLIGAMRPSCASCLLLLLLLSLEPPPLYLCLLYYRSSSCRTNVK